MTNDVAAQKAEATAQLTNAVRAVPWPIRAFIVLAALSSLVLVTMVFLSRGCAFHLSLGPAAPDAKVIPWP